LFVGELLQSLLQTASAPFAGFGYDFTFDLGQAR
jgi:hypothetical protein